MLSIHVDIAFNWIIMDLDEKLVLKLLKWRTPSGSSEQALMFQVTAKFSIIFSELNFQIIHSKTPMWGVFLTFCIF